MTDFSKLLAQAKAQTDGSAQVPTQKELSPKEQLKQTLSADEMPTHLTSVKHEPQAATVIEFAQHETQPDGLSPEITAEYQRQIAQLKEGFGPDANMVSQAIHRIANFIQEHPQLKETITPDDLGSIVQKLGEVGGAIVRGKKTKSSARGKKAASAGRMEDMAGNLIDQVLGS